MLVSVCGGEKERSGKNTTNIPGQREVIYCGSSGVGMAGLLEVRS